MQLAGYTVAKLRWDPSSSSGIPVEVFHTDSLFDARIRAMHWSNLPGPDYYTASIDPGHFPITSIPPVTTEGWVRGGRMFTSLPD